MNITTQNIIAWLVTGGLAGSFVGLIIRGKKQGFGILANIGIGVVGALIGGILFALFRIDFGKNITVSLNDLLAAVAGSLIFLVGIWIYRKQVLKKKSQSN